MPKLCEVVECHNRASYGFIGEFRAIYCCSHKNIKEGLIDIRFKNKYCKSCYLVRGTYGYLNDNKNLFCVNCKLNDMVNVNNKRCLKCDKQPIYGNPDDKIALYCGKHKLNDMIDIKNKRCLKCNKIASYGNPDDNKRLYCNQHKLNDMVDIRDKNCITPLCDKYKKLDKLCMRCFYALNPNDQRCKRVKIKENEVKQYIQQEFKDLSFIFDEPIKGYGLCFNIRPDVLIHLNNHSLIIEVDENQHKFYNSVCDYSRIHKIQESLNRPIIIIRFNPDDYVNDNNKKIKSCFVIDKKMGLTTIPKNKEEEWNDRLIKLKDTINDNLKYKYDDPIKIIKLFYDI